MVTDRDLYAEMDALHAKMELLSGIVQKLDRRLAGQTLPAGSRADEWHGAGGLAGIPLEDGHEQDASSEGGLYYAGRYRSKQRDYRWTPQERQVRGLLELDGEKAAKIIGALGHKQRLDLLRAVMQEPLTGAELVERLNMGTTGQLYHHIKALQGAGLLVQEERGGRYLLPDERALPLLLLLAAAADLLDTSHYLDMAEARSQAGAYLGTASSGNDPHLLLWALLENAILEHRAGYCREAAIFLHGDGSVTIADDGRGIPVKALAHTEVPRVQTVLTDIWRPELSAPYFAPGGEKGISAAVVNALSERLSVEIRREGSVFRQDYRQGIPQSGLLKVGVTKETGTSVTVQPDRELFPRRFERAVIEQRIGEIMAAYSDLQIVLHDDIV
ncbi:ATP-binding protein [Paenibacillus sp. MBLB4367]|uniref:ATP-binding protein n=1 Tax=Paenibacillus sp. MBLB4367 TaxID=3384767 RepID=UPI0039081CE2